MGISCSNSCPSMKKYYPLMFFKQHLCECISLWNPLDYSSSGTYWQVGGQLNLYCCGKQGLVPSFAWGPELNTDFRSSHRLALLRQCFKLTQCLNNLFWTSTHFWMAPDCLEKGSCGCPKIYQVFLTGYPLQNPCFHGLSLSED